MTRTGLVAGLVATIFVAYGCEETCEQAGGGDSQLTADGAETPDGGVPDAVAPDATPALTTTAGIYPFDQESFARLIDFRVGNGEDRFLYTIGDVRRHPGGDVIYHYEGVEICKSAPDEPRTATTATQLSRRIFFYVDPKTGKYVRAMNGNPVNPVSYSYLIMRWELQQNGSIEIEGTQGAQGVGPGVTTLTISVPNLRKLSNGLYHYPVNLYYSAGPVYYFHEVASYVSLPPKSALGSSYSGHMIRLQPAPSWAPQDQGLKDVILDLTFESMATFEQLPERLRKVISDEYPLYDRPPKDVAECLALQKGDSE